MRCLRRFWYAYEPAITGSVAGLTFALGIVLMIGRAGGWW